MVARGNELSVRELMQTAADALTSSNCYVRFDNEEPRIAFNNSTSAGCGISQMWVSLHLAARLGANLLAALDRGVLEDDPALEETTRAAALFTAAASQSSLALAWDRAYARTRFDPSALPELLPYAAVRDTALVLWDELIALTEGKSWQLPSEWLPLTGGAATAARLHRIARTTSTLP